MDFLHMIGNYRLFKFLKALTTAKAAVALIFAMNAATGAQPPASTAPSPAQVGTASATGSSRVSDSRVSAEARYRIGPGDVLDVKILNKPQFNREGVRVNQRGTIRIPLLKGEVKAACQTEEELEVVITDLLKEYVLDPQVTVQIREYLSEPVAVLGAVRVPSRFQLHRRVRLLDLLTYANGPTENAGLTIQVVHTEPAAACSHPSSEPEDSTENLASHIDYYKLEDTLQNDEKANPYMRPGDVVSRPPAA